MKRYPKEATIGVRLPMEIHRAIEMEAKADRRTLSFMVREILIKWYAEWKSLKGTENA
jgi:hypothetical protein